MTILELALAIGIGIDLAAIGLLIGVIVLGSIVKLFKGKSK